MSVVVVMKILTSFIMSLGTAANLKARKTHAWQPSYCGSVITPARASPLFSTTSSLSSSRFDVERGGGGCSRILGHKRIKKQPQRTFSLWKQISFSDFLQSRLATPRSGGKPLSTRLFSTKREDDHEGNTSIVVQPQDELLQRMDKLQRENKMLIETIKQLEVDNAELLQECLEARHGQKIVLETFEGETDEWCDELENGACPIEPGVSFTQAFRDRAYWLVGLLLLQSASGIILAKNEALIANHPFIVYFLTMLVGAGGNAGNQASVRVIRGLALGTLNSKTQSQFLTRELKMAISLSSTLTVAGFFRAAAFSTPFPETVAITSSLFLIVFSSICLGAVLPLGLKRLGIDPAHSSTSIQVIMDIFGVILAVGVSSMLLDSPLGAFIMSRLGG